jgi:hypothetical protein
MSQRSRSRSRGRGSGGSYDCGSGGPATRAVVSVTPCVPRLTALPTAVGRVGPGQGQVTVDAFTLGRTVTLPMVPGNMTVADIKATVHNQLGIPPGQQKLYFDNIIELWDELKVRLFGLNHLSLRLFVNPVPIDVHFLSGRVVRINTGVDASCGLIKEIVQDKTGIPWSQLRLYSAGTELVNGTLLDHGIGEGSIIELFVANA